MFDNTDDALDNAAQQVQRELKALGQITETRATDWAATFNRGVKQLGEDAASAPGLLPGLRTEDGAQSMNTTDTATLQTTPRSKCIGLGSCDPLAPSPCGRKVVSMTQRRPPCLGALVPCHGRESVRVCVCAYHMPARKTTPLHFSMSLPLGCLFCRLAAACLLVRPFPRRPLHQGTSSAIPPPTHWPLSRASSRGWPRWPNRLRRKLHCPKHRLRPYHLVTSLLSSST